MRRWLALIPAALLVFSFSPVAQAQTYIPKTITAGCLNSDTSTAGATVSLSWIKGGQVTPTNDAVLLLHKIVISNTCNSHYSRLGIPRYANGTTTQMEFAIMPGASRTLGHQALVKLGLYEMPFYHWYMTVTFHYTGDCCYFGHEFVVQSDGRVVASS